MLRTILKRLVFHFTIKMGLHHPLQMPPPQQLRDKLVIKLFSKSYNSSIVAQLETAIIYRRLGKRALGSHLSVSDYNGLKLFSKQ